MQLISDKCREFLVRLMDNQRFDRVVECMQLSPGEKLIIIGDLGCIVENLKRQVQDMNQLSSRLN